MDDLTKKSQSLDNILRGMKSAVIAYSGGVDSSFLIMRAFEILANKVVAVTATSSTYPSREFNEAKELACELGIKHIVIESEELDIPGFSENPPDRCYYCKGELFGKLKEIAEKEGYNFVLDGSNIDDESDYRPGAKAAKELSVRSPLKEAGLTKEEIRSLSKKANLKTWDKPAFACLASRFPYGTKITKEKLSKIEKGEEILRCLGFKHVRLRDHGDVARIEIPSDQLGKIISPPVREKISEELKALGYLYITLDIDGYRTGSMNEGLGLTVITSLQSRELDGHWSTHKGSQIKSR